MKKIIQFGIVALSALVLAGCGSTSTSSSKSSSTSSATQSSKVAKSSKPAASSTSSSQSSSSSSSSSQTDPAARSNNGQASATGINNETDAVNALIAKYGTNNGDTAYTFLGQSNINGQVAYNFDGYSRAAMATGARGQTGAFYVFANGKIVNTFEDPNGLNN